MTVEERLDALEAKTQYITIRNTHGVPGMYIAGCRVGINTSYWLDQPPGQGAQLAIGNGFDWVGLYVENEDQQCGDKASVAIYAAALAGGKQPNIAFQAVVGNASDANGVSQNYGFSAHFGDKALTIQREGFQLIGDWASFALGKVGGIIRTIWSR